MEGKTCIPLNAVYGDKLPLGKRLLWFSSAFFLGELAADWL